MAGGGGEGSPANSKRRLISGTRGQDVIWWMGVSLGVTELGAKEVVNDGRL